MQRIVFDAHDRPPQAPGGYNFISRLQLAQHLLPFFLAPLLRHDQKKVKDGKDKDQWGEAQKSQRATADLHRHYVLHVHKTVHSSAADRTNLLLSAGSALTLPYFILPLEFSRALAEILQLLTRTRDPVLLLWQRPDVRQTTASSPKSNRMTYPAHRVKVEAQVVDGIQDLGQELVGRIKMAQVRT